MNENIRKIVGQFIKTSPDNITDDTIIDRRAVGSSIIFHRMFAKLVDAGMVVHDYHSIKTFGDLMRHQNLKEANAGALPLNSLARVNKGFDSKDVALAVGIDMESINAMPLADDFREDTFYQQNFSASEISYCILQHNPYASFAGLFAAKEAIAKTDNKYMELPFNLIEIKHDLKGKPYFKDYAISISHTEAMAVSVVLNNSLAGTIPATHNNFTSEDSPPAKTQNNNLALGLSALALLVSVAAFGLIILRSLS